MMNRVMLAGHLLRHFGPRWVAYRAEYALQMRSGWLRHETPSFEWVARPLAGWLRDPELADPGRYFEYRCQTAPAFFFKPEQRAAFHDYFAAWDGASDHTPLDLAAAVQHGEFSYFDHTPAVAGLPPDWHANPFTGQRAPADRHWSAISDDGNGDIKLIWEVNRFSFTYALVRASWRTGDERYAELFWQLVEDWRAKNPPYRGPNWKCGQETTFRVMAWCFGLWGFLTAQATTPEHVADLAQLIAASGERIAGNFAYALSQRNNHGISEALGLWTIGTLFPEFALSARWQEQGRAALEQQAQQLIYDDGSFAQHSMNYHRLMLHDYVWVLRLAELNGLAFSDTLHERFCRASEWLYQLQDERSGRVPNYGQNDGALILPLTNADYQDYRPVLQGARYLASRTRTYAAGPWDEELLWLCGTEALTAPQQVPLREDFTAASGGYTTLRSDEGFAFTRCAEFRHRPAQADMLHVDIWWRGYNIACDAGTYSYHAPAPWNNALAGSACHNTVTVDGADQMSRAGKFLWLPWAQGRVRYTGHDDELGYWEGEHDGYQRLNPPASHRRGIVRLPDDVWLILDQVQSNGSHRYRLHWLLPDIAHEWNGVDRVTLKLPEASYVINTGVIAGSHAATLQCAAADSVRGWRSAYYYVREPALSWEVITQATNAMFWTVFSPQPVQVQADPAQIVIAHESWQAALALQPGSHTLIGAITVTRCGARSWMIA